MSAHSPRLILASTSPFRKELLQRLGLPFETASPEVDETPLANESPEQLVRRLAEAKARAVESEADDALIIGSDQIALLDDEILGKPGTRDRAVQQLERASGKAVVFLTGLCLRNTIDDSVELDVVPFRVQFRHLTPQQIEHYLDREQPYNCAGSFKSEGLGIALFERLEGEDPTALIGLPLIRLIRMLERNGVEIL